MKRESFYIYGRKPIYETLAHDAKNVMRVFISDRAQAHDADIVAIKELAREARIPFNLVTEANIKKYVGDVNDQGAVALLKEISHKDFQPWFDELQNKEHTELPVVLILDHIEDTHNFGAILRTALAVGVAGVIVAKDRQAPVNATVFKTSAGAATRVPIVQVANINQAIERLKDAHFWVAAVDMARDKRDIIWEQEFTTPMAFVVGREGTGVSQHTLEICDFVVSLPMINEVESLNVSVATACVLYEWQRQQHQSKKKS